MKKTLRKPDRWQDFEDLCKKLFGEIWQCSYTIKKNGRQGQPQCGVDVYAIPKGENDYFGIQCKGKDEYTDAKLSKKEVDEEIAKALNFKPSLNTFIFATTSNKDAEIEEYIRLKDIENRKNGKFKLLLYCWEDLVDLIEEHQNVFNWYVNGQQYREIFRVDVTFKNDSKELTVEPPFIKKETAYIIKKEIPAIYSTNYLEFLKKMNRQIYTGINALPRTSILGEPLDENLSWCSFNIYIKNTGNKVIEDWKLFLTVEKGKYRELDDDRDTSIFANIHRVNSNRNYWVYEKEGYYLYKPIDSPLIQQDIKSFEVAILPYHDCQSIKLTWKLLARDYNDSGKLTLFVIPKYEVERNLIEVESKDQLKPKSEEIVDKIVLK